MFRDRWDAGKQLAKQLAKYKGERPIVLALPRGGVPVGYEVARSLGAVFDVFIVRKLGAPNQPELGIGAVAPGGVIVLDTDTIRALGITKEEIERVAEAETAEMERRLRRFRGDRPMPALKDRTVILVDDGLATGVTAFAAVKALRRMNPRKIVLAVPVCAAQTAAILSKEVGDLICVDVQADFGAVGLWYRNFDQTSDEEVIRLLESARAAEAEVKEETGTTSNKSREPRVRERRISLQAEGVSLEGDLGIPEGAVGVVLFAHGSGSSRHSPRNKYVAQVLRGAGLATLLIDLLTPKEEAADAKTGHIRFDIELLAGRLIAGIDWLAGDPDTNNLRIGLFGASTGAGAALVAAAERPQLVGAVVSRGGRPDLAGAALPRVEAPTLLLVGGNDLPVIALNQEAIGHIKAEHRLVVVPGASHLFEEPGTLEEVARQAADWFVRHLMRL